MKLRSNFYNKLYFLLKSSLLINLIIFAHNVIQYMHHFYPLSIENIEQFKQELLALSHDTEHFCYLDSNNYPNYPYATFGSFFAIDAVASIANTTNCLLSLANFRKEYPTWMFGYFSYDIKNEIETDLCSNNIDNLDSPNLIFFVPRFIVKIENNKVELGVTQQQDIIAFHALFQQQKKTYNQPLSNINIQHRIHKDEYIAIVNEIKHQIKIGNIYELNFCQEFFVEDVNLNPLAVFQKLNLLSKAPFATYFRHKEHYLLCASPERFLKRQQHQLISQPIKGTRKRSNNIAEDKRIKQELFFNEKERSENVMIVDLVRNDLSKVAIKNSVEVEELFGLYTFEQVHQLISTISCQIPTSSSLVSLIQALFPMGSMTGAPKITAMQLIETYEKSRRGLFSGAVGYITPKENFDFNVVIRSILYNQQKRYCSMQTGSAITIDANAEIEYEECLLKAKALFMALK